MKQKKYFSLLSTTGPKSELKEANSVYEGWEPKDVGEAIMFNVGSFIEKVKQNLPITKAELVAIILFNQFNCENFGKLQMGAKYLEAIQESCKKFGVNSCCLTRDDLEIFAFLDN